MIPLLYVLLFAGFLFGFGVLMFALACASVNASEQSDHELSDVALRDGLRGGR